MKKFVKHILLFLLIFCRIEVAYTSMLIPPSARESIFSHNVLQDSQIPVDEKMLEEAASFITAKLKRRISFIDSNILFTYALYGAWDAWKTYDANLGPRMAHLVSKGTFVAIDLLREDKILSKNEFTAVQKAFSISLNDDGEKGIRDHEFLPDYRINTAQITETNDFIKTVYKKLNPAELLLIELLYSRHLTMKEASIFLDISEPAVSVGHSGIVGRLRNNLSPVLTQCKWSNPIVKKGYGARIKRIRKELLLTREEFAHMLGIRRQAVFDCEEEIAMPSLNHWIYIAHIFNIPLSYLLKGRGKISWGSIRKKLFFSADGWGNWIHKHRTRRLLTQAELAERVGVQLPVIWAWENEKQKPHPKNLIALAKALKAQPWYITERLSSNTIADIDWTPYIDEYMNIIAPGNSAAQYIKLIQEKRKETQDIKSAEILLHWYRTGEILALRNQLETTITPGKTKIIRNNGNLVFFSFLHLDPSQPPIDAILKFKKDPNLGMVLQCFYNKDMEFPEKAKSFATFKYIPSLKKVFRIDLASYDIVSAAYNLKPIKTLQRSRFIGTVTKEGKVTIASLTDNGAYERIKFKIPPNKLKQYNLIGKKVIIILKKDQNQKQVITMLHFEPARRLDMLVHLKTFKFLANRQNKSHAKKRVTGIDNNKIDVIDACNGKELVVYNRPVEAVIGRNKKFNTGLCQIGQGKEVASFNIPKKHLTESDFGQKAVIRVEKDINQGQVIALYRKTEFDQSNHPVPLVMYKYIINEKTAGTTDENKGAIRIINLAACDIAQYVTGNQDIKPVTDRTIEIPVRYASTFKSFQAHLKRGFNNDGKFVFALLPKAQELFIKGKKGQTVTAKIMHHANYCSYVTIYSGTHLLGEYFYSKRLGKCVPVDFPRMAMVDYAHNEVNHEEKPIKPDRYRCQVTITPNGISVITWRGKTIRIYGLSLLKGKKPLFMPFSDDGVTFIIHAHDAEAFDKNPNRMPEYMLKRVKDGVLKPSYSFDIEPHAPAPVNNVAKLCLAVSL